MFTTCKIYFEISKQGNVSYYFSKYFEKATDDLNTIPVALRISPFMQCSLRAWVTCDDIAYRCVKNRFSGCNSDESSKIVDDKLVWMMLSAKELTRTQLVNTKTSDIMRCDC